MPEIVAKPFAIGGVSENLMLERIHGQLFVMLIVDACANVGEPVGGFDHQGQFMSTLGRRHLCVSQTLSFYASFAGTVSEDIDTLRYEGAEVFLNISDLDRGVFGDIVKVGDDLSELSVGARIGGNRIQVKRVRFVAVPLVTMGENGEFTGFLDHQFTLGSRGQGANQAP